MGPHALRVGTRVPWKRYERGKGVEGAAKRAVKGKTTGGKKGKTAGGSGKGTAKAKKAARDLLK